MSLSVRRRAFLLLSFLVFFGAAQASANVSRKDTARGIYGETSSDNFPAPTAITISDSGGPLLEITSFGKCVTSESDSCGFENLSNSTPNFVYFYVVRFLRTPTGQTKLTIPGQFEDPIFLATLEANMPPITMDVFAGVITDDQTNIAACMTLQSTSTSLINCEGAFFDATDSTVDKTGAVLIINPGLQANDTIELHVDSYVPPACFSDPDLDPNNPSPFNCPANSLMTVSQNGSTLKPSAPLQVIGPVQSLSVDQTTGNSISPAGTIVAQLNVNPASVTLPQTTSLPISITAINSATPPFIIGQNSQILWNGQPLATSFNSPSGVPTASATAAASLLASGGIATITVTNGGATSDPIAFPLFAPDPQNISVPPAQQSLVQGSGPVTLTVSGTGFLPSSVVQWNSSGPSTPNCFTGNNRPTTFVSSTELTATIFADDLRTDTATTPVIVVFAEPGTDSCGQVAGVGFGADVNALAITAASNPLPSLSQTNIAFGNETVGVPSTAQTVTLANNGNAPLSLTISNFSIMGADSADFALGSPTTQCTVNETLAAGHSCNLAVTFTPIHAGARTASLQISNNSNFATISIPLTGTGVSPVPTLTSINPTTVTAGTATFNLTLTGTNFTADSTVAFGANPPLTPSSTPTATQMVVSVPAADIAAGGVMGVTVNNPAPGGGTSTPAVNFTVTGPPSFAIAASPTTVTTLAAASTTMASQTSTITVSPSNGFSGTITVTCSNSVPGVTCPPLTIPSGSVTGNLTVNVLDPSTQMMAMLQPVPENQWAQGSLPDQRDRGAWLTLSAGAFFAAFFVFFLPGRTRYRLAPALGVICAVSLAMGCGGGTYSGGGGAGTSPTTTQLTVSATKVAVNGGITVSATVTGGTPDGNVQFFVDGNALGGTIPVVNGSTGNISLTAAQAPMFLQLVGTHTVSAHYLGGTYTAASASGALNITVTGKTNLPITGTSGNFTPGASVSLTIN